jgi:hypothetical protein
MATEPAIETNQMMYTALPAETQTNFKHTFPPATDKKAHLAKINK